MGINLRSQCSGAICLVLLHHAASLAAERPTLHQSYSTCFRVGAAVGTGQIVKNDGPTLDLVARQFNSITSENLLKWASVHPRLDQYRFGPADQFVQFGEAHGMWIVGHTLLWHNQTPAWVFRDEAGRPLAREALLDRLKRHIHSVAGRYQGRIDAWDVVNEAINDDGSLRDTPWRRLIGDDYVEKAFQFAHEADPNAELYYNDYLLYRPAKRDAVARLVRRLQGAGCRIDGVGIQAHWGLEYPKIAQIDAAIDAFSALELKVMITELDVNVLPSPDPQQNADVSRRGLLTPRLNPYVDGLPADMQRKLAERYAELFALFVRRRDSIDRVTLWGVDDGHSWHNNWPVRGRTAHSLLFDRDLAPKPAFDAVLRAAPPRTGAEVHGAGSF